MAVWYSDHHLVNGAVFRPPFEYWSAIQMSCTIVLGIWIANHLNNKLVKVPYSDVHVSPPQCIIQVVCSSLKFLLFLGDPNILGWTYLKLFLSVFQPFYQRWVFQSISWYLNGHGGRVVSVVAWQFFKIAILHWPRFESRSGLWYRALKIMKIISL